jgi:hypothetical protein
MPKQDGNIKIVESFITSNKPMSLNNKNIYYNEYSDEVLIRYYQTLIAVRKDKSVRILEGINNYSASTNALVRLIERIAKEKGCTVSYVKQFAKGSTIKGAIPLKDFWSKNPDKKIYFVQEDKEEGTYEVGSQTKDEYEDSQYWEMEGTYDNYEEAVAEAKMLVKNAENPKKTMYVNGKNVQGLKYGNGGGVAVSSESGLAFGTNAELLMNEQNLRYEDGGRMGTWCYEIGGL